MKKFRFHLQSYLNVCRRREEMEQLRLFEAQQRAKQAQSRILQLENYRTRLETELRRADPILAPHEFALYHNCLRKIQEDLPALFQARSTALQAVSQQQERLSTAMRKRRVLERLRERRSQAHAAKQETQERLEIEELFLQIRATKEQE